jgi:hypothetical protein
MKRVRADTQPAARAALPLPGALWLLANSPVVGLVRYDPRAVAPGALRIASSTRTRPLTVSTAMPSSRFIRTGAACCGLEPKTPVSKAEILSGDALSVEPSDTGL